METSPDKNEPRDKNAKKVLDAKQDNSAGKPKDTDKTPQTTKKNAPANEPVVKETAERNPTVPETKEEVNPNAADHALDAHTGEGKDFRGSAPHEPVKPY